MAKITEPRTYDYDGWSAVIGDRDSRRIGNNTYAERTGPTEPYGGDLDTVSIRLHGTYVATFHRDGAIDLNTGGWFTVTTKDRINAALPQRYYVASVKGVWHLYDRQNGAPAQWVEEFDAWGRLTIPAPIQVPEDWPVQPLVPGQRFVIAEATCGTCGRSWDDGVSTSVTPVPSARCPFEPFHEDHGAEVPA